MAGLFLPAVQKIQYHNNDVRKDVKKLPNHIKKRLEELFRDLRLGQVPRTGKNIAQVGNVKKYRLNDQYRVAFSVREGTALIKCIGDHPRMEKYMAKVETEIRKHRR